MILEPTNFIMGVATGVLMVMMTMFMFWNIMHYKIAKDKEKLKE